MDSSTAYILKVFLISGGLAVAIKYAAPYFSISASTGIALTSVWLPSVIVAIALGWRARYSNPL
ncbi:MAG: hypothetical protein HC879_14600 [Leptolyngbyaceae cyanobacterium SL_5_9]|nr:hypothetical protein [Leptolyngbyaceae cyanobacterium SM1_4_3]NJN58626.1 hypothetical protein [Leptolyngbyaceae cyanobacterium SL_5_9]